ncbi:MAG: mechanosensitive ion channel family protein [Actinomycetota bacterium]|nr:mechanosensitive ion channel family protein [Actinomycetota bacterium]
MDATWRRLARRDLTRAAIGTLILIVGMFVAAEGRLREQNLKPEQWIPAVAGAAAVLIGGVVAVRALARALRKLSADNLGDARGAGLSLLVTVIGYLIVLITVLSALKVNPAGLLLGGAITGVVLGIAAQQTLSNFFAGIVLLVNRPLVVGEEVCMRSGPLGGEFEGRVVDMSLFYVKLMTEQGPVSLPNAAVLASAIGPGAHAPKEEDKEEEDEQVSPAAGGAPDGTDRSASA